MSIAGAICIGKLCASGAALLGATVGDSFDHVKAVLEGLASGGEAASKLRGAETPTLLRAMRKARLDLEKAYDEALRQPHSPGFAEVVALAFENLSEVFDQCLPGGSDLARLRHDPEKIGDWIADRAVARKIEVFEGGEGRRLLVSLLVLAYRLLDKDPAFMAALARVNWNEAFGQLEAIRGDVSDLTRRQDAHFSEVEARLDKLLRIAEQGGSFQAAAAAGISRLAVRKIVERLGGEGIGDTDLLPWLDNWIEAARVELGRRANEDEAFEAARLEAECRFRAGRDDASDALMVEFMREERMETERQEEHKRRQLRLLQEAVRIDELQLRPEAAVAKLRRMAVLEGQTGTDEVGLFLSQKGGEFFDRGSRKKVASALLLAIAAYRAALEEWTRERVPLQWAGTQNDLGSALATLGVWDSGTARLHEAIQAYRAALEGLSRERVPLQWALTQSNLGAVLEALGERDSGTARLVEAVGIYRAALQERTRERVPLQWAETQNNLGNALRTLGERDSGTARLEEAVKVYRAALEERTRERAPLDWALTQSNLGAALTMLGERNFETARLEEAVKVQRAALEEWTRERVPFDRAATQNSLGNALVALGKRNSEAALLEEAVTLYRAALQERTCDRMPLEWAMTQNNLGIALAALGARHGASARLDEAVQAYRAALEERTCEGVPLQWATTQNNLGNALLMLGERESGIARLEEAAEAYRAATKGWTRECRPLDWAAAQNNLGNALLMLGRRGSDTGKLQEAVEAHRAALEEWTQERMPIQWAMAQYGLKGALRTLQDLST